MSCSMKWKIVKARTTKINRAASTPRRDLEHYCRDLNGWPRSWMGLEKDLPPGEQLVAFFRRTAATFLPSCEIAVSERGRGQ